jgi:hypothetical protein
MTKFWLKKRSRGFSSRRLAMWVWATDVKTQANIDTMITWCTGRVSDLLVFAIDNSVSPATWLGTGTLGDPDATVISGTTPFQYIISRAHAVGIKVHAWIWLNSFAYWGSTTGLMTPDCPNNATYNDAGIWNFNNATARTLLINTIADFITQNPGIDGINFDLEATTDNILTTDMTTFMTDLRAAVPTIEFSFCTGGIIGNDEVYKISMGAWITANLVDTVTLMAYYRDHQRVKAYVSALPTLSSHHLIRGVGMETNLVTADDIRYRWLQLISEGYIDYVLFCWGDYLKGDAVLRGIVDSYLASTLVASQTSITKVSVTPSTSWTITVGGVDQTTAYADVADHVYSGPLKLHVEAAIGSENPAVIYYRNNSAVTTICVGDFQP